VNVWIETVILCVVIAKKQLQTSVDLGESAFSTSTCRA